MRENEILARVILRPDGSVHIAFKDVRSVRASADDLIALFSDPMEFIESGSHKRKSSTFDINRNRIALEDILGLTLAYVNSDKQIVCNFPELFGYIFDALKTPSERTRPLNMKSFELETALSDEKSFLLRYYLEFANARRPALTIKKNIKLRDEVQFQIVREILNSYFEEELPKPIPAVNLADHIKIVESPTMYQGKEDAFISVREYAKMKNLSTATIRDYIHRDLLKSAIRTESGQYFINKNDEPIKWDRRSGRKRKRTGDQKFYKRPSSGSAADVEESILKGKYFTPAIAPYIHTFEELDYYMKNNYHEVLWDGRPCLIIDVNPDYISEKTGVRNRDLMKEGKAPVVPDRNKEEYHFHIHHVGQHDSSPFAIIPEYDHNSKGFSAIFHQGAPNTDLHGPEFEALKTIFWRTYLKEYDQAVKFSLIPFLNSKHTKDKR